MFIQHVAKFSRLAPILHYLGRCDSRLIDLGASRVQSAPDEETVAKLQGAILRYLADRPHASDTVRGIARYWTGAEGTPTAKPPLLEVVQLALDALVVQGWIGCVMLAGGTRVYEANSQRRAGAEPCSGSSVAGRRARSL